MSRTFPYQIQVSMRSDKKVSMRSNKKVIQGSYKREETQNKAKAWPISLYAVLVEGVVNADPRSPTNNANFG